jgi:hypothetical protein
MDLKDLANGDADYNHLARTDIHHDFGSFEGGSKPRRHFYFTARAPRRPEELGSCLGMEYKLKVIT